MVQEFIILRCFSCTTFQVHQVKKSKKWTCKVCGEKQSVKKVYAQGSGQECRKHVQRLNMKCGELQMAKDLILTHSSDENSDTCSFSENVVGVEPVEDITCETRTRLHHGESKWKKFMEVSSCDQDEEDFGTFDVTTVRDVFGKDTTKGKRKLVQKCPTTDHHHKQKRLKKNSKGNAENNLRDHTSSSKSCEDVASPKQYTSSGPHSNGMLSYSNLQLNPENSQKRCNVYFAKVTRDSAPEEGDSVITAEQKMPSFSTTSIWTKYLPISSSETKEPASTHLAVATSSFLEKKGLPPHPCSEISQSYRQCSAILADCDPNSCKAESFLAEDLFQVDDKLEEEWWNTI
ncbi:MRN complex-interacting protein-like [Montipora capricornis]|uniref:MRN complex-interacting protein-like n=1 Tax=Montipora capricornis TaxID=246305 RepID=UPI0035F1D5D6